MMMDMILFYLLLASIWWLYSFAYKDYMIDESRQRLFEIRDALFDKAMDGEVSFDDDAYQLIRDILNGLIRFTHNIGIVRFLVMGLVAQGYDKQYREEFSLQLQASLDKLSSSQQKIYKLSLVRAHIVIAYHMVNTSPLFSVIFLPMRLCIYLLNKIRNINDSCSDKALSSDNSLWKSIDARANFISHTQA